MGKKVVSAVTVSKVKAKWLDFATRHQKNFPKIPVARILAHIAGESSGDPNAQGDFDKNGVAHSFGLMQVQQGALTDFNNNFDKHYTMDQLKADPWIQIEVGTGFLELKRRAAASLPQASRDYNDGNPFRDNAMSIAYGEKIEALNTAFEKALVA